MEEENPSELLVGLQTGTATMNNSMEFPQKTKNGTAFWPSNYTTAIISLEPWNTNPKEPVHPNWDGGGHGWGGGMPLEEKVDNYTWITIRFEIMEYK